MDVIKNNLIKLRENLENYNEEEVLEYLKEIYLYLNIIRNKTISLNEDGYIEESKNVKKLTQQLFLYEKKDDNLREYLLKEKLSEIKGKLSHVKEYFLNNKVELKENNLEIYKLLEFLRIKLGLYKKNIKDEVEELRKRETDLLYLERLVLDNRLKGLSIIEKKEEILKYQEIFKRIQKNQNLFVYSTAIHGPYYYEPIIISSNILELKIEKNNKIEVKLDDIFMSITGNTLKYYVINEKENTNLKGNLLEIQGDYRGTSYDISVSAIEKFKSEEVILRIEEEKLPEIHSKEPEIRVLLSNKNEYEYEIDINKLYGTLNEYEYEIENSNNEYIFEENILIIKGESSINYEITDIFTIKPRLKSYMYIGGSNENTRIIIEQGPEEIKKEINILDLKKERKYIDLKEYEIERISSNTNYEYIEDNEKYIINRNQIELKPDYRNIEYKIEIKTYDENYIAKWNKYIINVKELEAIPPKRTEKNIYLNRKYIEEELKIDVSNYFKSPIDTSELEYIKRIDIIEKNIYNEERKEYEKIRENEIRNDSNLCEIRNEILKIKPDYRYISYRIKINCKDIYYDIIDEKEELEIVINEKKKTETIKESETLRNGTEYEIKRDVSLYFKNTDIYEIELMGNVRSNLISGEEDVIRLENTSNLIIKPDYRNTNYGIRVLGINEEYMDHPSLMYIYVYEEAPLLPKIKRKDIEIERELKKEEYEISLKENYDLEIYRNRKERLEFIIKNEDEEKYEINEGILKIKADYRGENNEIYIYAKDKIYNVWDVSDYITIRYEEKYPIELLEYEIPIITEEIFEINLNEIFKVREESNLVCYFNIIKENIEIELRQTISGENGVEIRDNILKIVPDYREINYNVKITGFDINYINQKISRTIEVREKGRKLIEPLIEKIIINKYKQIYFLDNLFEEQNYYTNTKYKINSLKPNWINIIGRTLIIENRDITNTIGIKIDIYEGEKKINNKSLEIRYTEIERKEYVNLTNEKKIINIDEMMKEYEIKGKYESIDLIEGIIEIKENELEIKPNLRNEEYNVEIFIKDIEIDYIILQFDVLIKELPPFYIDENIPKNKEINIRQTDVRIIEIKDDLRKYIQKNVINSNIILSNNVLNKPRNSHYKLNDYYREAYEMDEDGNIIIFSDYRNMRYNIDIIVYLENYEYDNYIISYIVNEPEIPKIKETYDEIEILGLSNISKRIYLEKYFKNYVFYSSLRYEAILESNIFENEISYKIDGKYLELSPDYLGTEYNIWIKAIDEKFENESCNLKIKVSEIYPPPINLFIRSNEDITMYIQLNYDYKIEVEGKENDFISKFEKDIEDVVGEDVKIEINELYNDEIEVYDNKLINDVSMVIRLDYEYEREVLNETEFVNIIKNDIIETIGEENTLIDIINIREGSIIVEFNIKYNNISSPYNIGSNLIENINNDKGIGYLKNSSEREKVFINYTSDITTKDIGIRQLYGTELIYDLKNIAGGINAKYEVIKVTDENDNIITYDNIIIEGSIIRIENRLRGIGYNVYIKISNRSSYHNWKLIIFEHGIIFRNRYYILPKELRLNHIKIEYDLKKYYETEKSGEIIFEISHTNIENSIGLINNKRSIEYDEIEKIIRLNPEYRNIQYDIDIKVYVEEYSNFAVNEKIVVIEEDFSKIEILTEKYKNYENISNNKIEFNIDEYINVYPYNVNYELEIRNYETVIPEIFNVETRNPYIYGNYRNMNYSILLKVYNTHYIEQTSNSYIIADINEVKPLVKNIEKLTLGKYDYEIDRINLDEYFTNYTNIEKIEYTLYKPSVRKGYYNNEKDAIEIENNILIINPEYRGLKYEFNIDAYINGYISLKETILIEVIESNIIPIEFVDIGGLINSNLIEGDRILINLKEYYNEYPFVNNLRYESNIKTELKEGREEYDISLNVDEISVTGKVRDMLYEIDVIAYDDMFNQSNNEMNIRIHEKPPFNKDLNYPLLNELRAKPISIFINQFIDNKIQNIYTNNTLNDVIKYNITLSNIDEPISNIIVEDIIFDEELGRDRVKSFRIKPKYRGVSYGIYIEPYMEEYEWYNNIIDKLEITELENPVKGDVVSCNVYIYDEILEFNFKELLGLPVEYELSTLLTISSNIYGIDENENYNRERGYIFDIEYTSNNEKITFYGGYVGIQYSILFSFLDSGTIATQINFNVIEYPPLSESINNDLSDIIGTLKNIQEIRILNDYFENNHKTENKIEYEIISCNIRDENNNNLNIIGYHKNVEIAYINNDILYINPDYRGGLATINVKAYINGYENQGIERTIIFEEERLPEIERIMDKEIIENMKLNTINCNIENYYNILQYPYSDYLRYNIISNKYDNIIIDNSNIYISALLRGEIYDINVEIYDYVICNLTKKTIDIIEIHELPPVERIREYEILSLIPPPEYKININNFFISNHPLSNIYYSIEADYRNVLVYFDEEYSNIVLGTQYRGRTYNLILEAWIDGYPKRHIDIIEITELNNPLDGDIVNIDIFINSIETHTLNISEALGFYINLYDRYDIEYNWDGTRYDENNSSYKNPVCNIIYNTNEQKIEFIGQLVGYSYEINVSLNELNTSNTVYTIRYNVTEKAPLEIINDRIDILELTHIKHIESITNHLINNIPNERLKYECNIPNVREAYYINEKIIEILNDNLIINPEYRNTNYEIPLTIYIDGYEDQSISTVFNISELNIPPIVFLPNDNLSKSNLIKEIETYDLRNYFNDYPFVEELIFTSNILTPLEEGRNNYNVNIDNELNLIIELDVRDQYYEIEIIAYDIKFNGSNEEMKIRIQEEKPLEIISNIEFKELTNENIIYNLNDIIKDNIDEETFYIICNISLDEILFNGIYNNKEVPIEINESNLLIYPEYRNVMYTNRIEVWKKGYENQRENIYVMIEENKIENIELYSNIINIDKYINDVLILDIKDYIKSYTYIEKLDYDVIDCNVEYVKNENIIDILSGGYIELKIEDVMWNNDRNETILSNIIINIQETEYNSTTEQVPIIW